MAAAADIATLAGHRSWQRSSVWLGHRQVEVDRVGHGEPLVFLHGWGLGPRAYRDPINALAGHGWHVIAPALPGFGDSHTLPPDHATLDDHADVIAGALTELDTAPPYRVVAHSFGAGIAVRLAHRHPHLVSRLVLVTPVGGAGASATSWGRLLLGLLSEADRDLALRVSDTLPNFLRSPLAIARSAVTAKTADLCDDIAWAARRIPVDLMLADRDGIVPPGRLRDCTAAHVTVFHGRHGWLLTSPHEFAASVGRALQRPAAAAAC